jgi:hypothetical protein
MQNHKERLDLDLDFLDETKPSRPSETPVETGYKYNWKNIFIIGGIALAVVVIIILYNTESTVSTKVNPPVYVPNDRQPTNYDNDTVTVGQYRCSKSDSARAKQMAPVNSAAIDMEKRALERRSQALASLRQRIESSAVNQYSPQFAINEYNEMIDTYNTQLQSFRLDASGLETKISQYNVQVQAYNAYLSAHCVRR